MRTLLGAVLSLMLVSCSDEPSAAPQGPASSTTSYETDIEPVSTIGHTVLAAVPYTTEDAVVLAGDNQVASIDPEAETVSWTADVPGFGVAEGFGSLWVTDLEGNKVRRLDPATGNEQATIPLGGGPIPVLATSDEVWVGGHRDGLVYRLDPRTNKVTARVRVAPHGSIGPHNLASEARDLYVDVGESNSVIRIDMDSAKVTGRFPMTGSMVACGQLVVDRPLVWVTGCFESDQVARIDTRTGDVHNSDYLSAYGISAFIAGDLLWVAAVDYTVDDPEEAGVFIALDTATRAEVSRLRTGNAGAFALLAFGSWWVEATDGLQRFDPADLQR